jgi:iron complex transport system ATP-binding protein
VTAPYAGGPRSARGLRAVPPCWEARDVRFAHTGAGAPTLDGVSLNVPAGGLTALLGPNGAGKSTLLQLLLGTLAPDAGEVRFRGRPLGGWPRAELARAVGVVPQGEDAAFAVTARELVEMGRYPHLGPWRRAGAADRRAVADAMVRCDVAHLAGRAVHTLSGGERQRALVARALAQAVPSDDARGSAAGAGDQAAVLALDEPTAALDVRHEMQLFELLRALADGGATVLLVTHHLNLAARYADHLVLLDAGRVVAAGLPAHVLTRAHLERVFRWPVEVVPHPGPGPDAGAPQVVPLSAPPRHAVDATAGAPPDAPFIAS